MKPMLLFKPGWGSGRHPSPRSVRRYPPLGGESGETDKNKKLRNKLFQPESPTHPIPPPGGTGYGTLEKAWMQTTWKKILPLDLFSLDRWLSFNRFWCFFSPLNETWNEEILLSAYCQNKKNRYLNLWNIQWNFHSSAPNVTNASSMSRKINAPQDKKNPWRCYVKPTEGTIILGEGDCVPWQWPRPTL